MKHYRKILVLAAIGLLATGKLCMRPGQLNAADPSPPGELNAKPEIVEAWREMRFGMFVCWGPVTLTGEDIGWSRGLSRTKPIETRIPEGGRGPTPAAVYDNLYKKWKPDRFDAREWVEIAREGGAKYIIFLVKHHDGYCLFDTKLTDYKSTGPEAAWKRDVLKDVADACHESGMKLIVYYSQPDWHHPDYRTANHARYIEYLHGQIREILTNYGKIDGLWFDGLGGEARDWDAEKLIPLARSLQPWLVINNRYGLQGDYDTPEQTVGKFQVDRPWESCVTLGTQWAWKPDDKIKSLKQCIDLLVNCSIRGGNLALDTGPMPDGRIEPRQAQRYREIGAWLKQYGESIYGTNGGPIRPARWGGTTSRGDTIYVHVIKWPGESVKLPPLPKKVVSHRLLTGGEATVEQSAESIVVRVPPADRQPLDTIIALTMDGPVAELEAIPNPTGSLTFGKKAAASNVYRQRVRKYGPDFAVDDDPLTRWGCDTGTHSAWLEVDLGQPLTFNRTEIVEAYGRIRRFELQVEENGQWRTFYRGTTIGEEFSAKFAPVTGRKVRLNLLDAVEAPSICEFQLYHDK
ncbi:MAG: alpha-L-fucosidase [Pirellulales bacterium]|nr:alpha-L-fucosidase [Pirellulales bacterium]